MIQPAGEGFWVLRIFSAHNKLSRTVGCVICKAMASQRHAELSPAELDGILVEMDSKHTRMAMNNAVSVFKDYLTSS